MAFCPNCGAEISLPIHHSTECGKCSVPLHACRFCSFNSVCHFNENEEGYQARKLQKLGKKEDVIELMKESMDSKE